MENVKLVSEIKKLDFKDNMQQAEIQIEAMTMAKYFTSNILEEYNSHPDTMGGIYICSDTFKELFPSFKKREDRLLANDPIHNSSAVLAATQFEEILKKDEPNKTEVVFLTGIPGAGKTTSIKQFMSNNDKIKLIFEGQLANPTPTIPKIEKCLEKGLNVTIMVAHIEPEKALDNTFKRFNEYGRGGSIEVMSNIQGNLPNGLKKLKERFGDKIKIVAYDKNNNDKVYYNESEILQLINIGSKDEIYRRLETKLNQDFKEGKISQACYEQASKTKLNSIMAINSQKQSEMAKQSTLFDKFMKTFKWRVAPFIAAPFLLNAADNAMENFIDSQAFSLTRQERNMIDIQMQELKAIDALNNMDLNQRIEITDFLLLSDTAYIGWDKYESDTRRLAIEEALKQKGWEKITESHLSSSFDASLYTRTKEDGTQQTVIAIRGTDPEQGLFGRDIIGADRNILTRSIPIEQTKDMLSQVNAWKEQGLLKGEIITTGHSLGGGLAGILKLAMPETIDKAYTVNSADYGKLYKGMLRIGNFFNYAPVVQDGLINYSLNSRNIEAAKDIFNLHGDINGSTMEAIARTVANHSISNPNQKLGYLANIPSSQHGAKATIRMLQLSNILVAATGQSNERINSFLKNFIEKNPYNNLGGDRENVLFENLIKSLSKKLNLTETNEYLMYDKILESAKSGNFKISLQEIENIISTITPESINNPLENNQILKQMPNVAKKEDEYDINEEFQKNQILNSQTNSNQNKIDGIEFGKINNNQQEYQNDEIFEEPIQDIESQTISDSEIQKDDDFITIANPTQTDEEPEIAQTKDQTIEQLNDTAFFEDTTQNIFDKDKFAFTGKRNATQDEVNEFEKEEKEKQDGSNLKDGSVKNEEQTKEEKAQKQAQADRIRELGAKYFMERDEKKFLAVSQGRFPFSENMLKLSACVNNQLAVMNMPGNGLQYSINQSEGCFQKDIEASKRAVEKSKESLKQFSGFPMQGLLPLALLLHIIKSSYEEHKQLKYQLINFVEAKELEKLRKMTPDQLEDYFKQKTLLSGEADYTTNAQTVEDFKNTFHDEIKENLDSASKFSTNGRYENADEMLKNNFLDEKLSDDEIQNLSQTNSNEFKKDLFDTNKINTQADKISLEVCDNLSKIYNIHGNEIDKNIDFLEDQCQENLKKLANNDTIFESNKIITDKVMSQTQMQNEEAKQKIADIVNLKVDDFHRKFANTGELDWDRLEKSIDEKVKEINPNATGLGKFVVQAIDHERLTNTADTKYFLKDMGAISKIHDSLSKIDFFKNNIKDNKNAYKNMFDAIRDGKSDKLELIINSMPFNKSAYSMFNKLSSVFKTAQVSDYESNKLMITHLLPARLNFLKLHFNDGKNVKNPNFDLMSLKTSDEMREADSNKISKTSIKDLVKISANPYKYLFASNINIVETKEKFTTKDGEILKVLTKPFGGIVSQKMDNSLPVNDPHRIVGTLLSSGHTPKTIRDLAPVLDKLSFAKNIDLKALTRIFPALKELESLGVKIKGLDFANANSVAKAFQDIKTFLPKPVGLLSSFGAKMALYESFGEALKSKSFKLWNDPNFAAFKQTSDYTKSLNPTFQEMDNIKKLFGMFCVANAIKKQTKNINNLPPKEDDNINISNKSKI